MNRPWVNPEQIRKYSQSDKVKARLDDSLKVDISRAEAYVIYVTHNSFVDENALPSDVETAVVLLSEAYAKQSILQKDGLMTSETFDDYSYTASKNDSEIADSLGIGILLSPYVKPSSGNVNMKLRIL